MGIYSMGPPTEYVGSLHHFHGVQTFVETGTYLGETARWASSIFESVITIERSPELYQALARKTDNPPNVKYVFGNTRDELPGVVENLNGPAVFWLDAHWSGGTTYGQTDECPLIDEISLINASSARHFILIDDARLFLAPPPPPHNAKAWPGIARVLEVLDTSTVNRYTVVVQDCIISVPGEEQDRLIEYCRSLPPAGTPTSPTAVATVIAERLVRRAVARAKRLPRSLGTGRTSARG